MRIVRAATGVAMVLGVLAWSTIATASSATTRLGVSVTVVRSCSLSTSSIDGVSSTLRLACSSTHTSRVLIGTAVEDARITAASGDHHVAASHRPQTDRRFQHVMVNF